MTDDLTDFENALIGVLNGAMRQQADLDRAMDAEQEGWAMTKPEKPLTPRPISIGGEEYHENETYEPDVDGKAKTVCITLTVEEIDRIRIAWRDGYAPPKATGLRICAAARAWVEHQANLKAGGYCWAVPRPLSSEGGEATRPPICDEAADALPPSPETHLADE